MEVSVFKKYAVVALAVMMTAFGSERSHAQNPSSLVVPLLSYRTGPFAGSGIPMANGTRDYLNMLNERDGGVGGVRIEVKECETAYDTKKGVECYETVKGLQPVVMIPFSTGTTQQLIARSKVDKIPLLTLAYGLSAAAVGETFPWVFNPPATYWDCLSMVMEFIKSQENGGEGIRGKKLGFIYLDAGFGRETIPLLEQYAKRYGFEVKLYPVAAQEMQNQSAQWLSVRRDNPAWMIMWGWGAMHPTAIKEAAKIGFPMKRFISNWWAGTEGDVVPAGEMAKGFRAFNWHGAGSNYPAFADIERLLLSKGLSQASRAEFGQVLYNRGVYNGVMIAEAIRHAQNLTGKKIVIGEDVRRGFEGLQITADRWNAMGLPNFGAPVQISCKDHSGHHASFVQEWDGSKWQRISDWIEPDTAVVRPKLEEAAADYVSKNQPWQPREEACP